MLVPSVVIEEVKFSPMATRLLYKDNAMQDYQYPIFTKLEFFTLDMFDKHDRFLNT